MTIKEMNDILKEMKKACAYKDDESDICVRTANDPHMLGNNSISLKTKIGEINVDLFWQDNKAFDYCSKEFKSEHNK